MRYGDFIARFPKQRKTQRGVLVTCPSHDDSPKSPSLHISQTERGDVLLKCFAGCTCEQVVSSLGLSMKDLFAEERSKNFVVPVRNDSKKETNEKPEIEKIYQYQDVNGFDVYQALRMRPKSFRQRHMVNGEWKWNMDGVERVLFRLPEIIKSKTVWVVEGEKDALNLVELGLESTCNVGGAGKWLDSYSESLKDKDIVICGDNDEPGEKHVKLVFDSLAGTAKSVRIVKLPKTVKDVSDYIAGFKHPSEALAALHDLASAAYPHIKGYSLPVYSVSEIEDDYRRFVRSMNGTAFSLGKWLPTLGLNLRFLVPGELVFIIGNTGTGKTGILQQIAKAAMPLPTLMFELELPKELMFERFVSMVTKHPCDFVEQAYQTADETLHEQIDKSLKNLFICPVSRLTVGQMEDIIMRTELKMGERPKVVLIDYIQLISGNAPTRREKVSDIAEQLKVMAKSTRTIVIVTSQITRPKDVDEKWEPNLHSAKESGSIEASCGLLLSAWQDFNDASTLNIRVLKSTKGGTGTFVQCNFDGARMIITEKAKKIPECEYPN